MIDEFLKIMYDNMAVISYTCMAIIFFYSFIEKKLSMLIAVTVFTLGDLLMFIIKPDLLIHLRGSSLYLWQQDVIWFSFFIAINSISILALYYLHSSKKLSLSRFSIVLIYFSIISIFIYELRFIDRTFLDSFYLSEFYKFSILILYVIRTSYIVLLSVYIISYLFKRLFLLEKGYVHVD